MVKFPYIQKRQSYGASARRSARHIQSTVNMPVAISNDFIGVEEVAPAFTAGHTLAKSFLSNAQATATVFVVEDGVYEVEVFATTTTGSPKKFISYEVNSAASDSSPKLALGHEDMTTQGHMRRIKVVGGERAIRFRTAGELVVGNWFVNIIVKRLL